MVKQPSLKLLRRYYQQLILTQGGVNHFSFGESGFSLLEVLVTILVLTGFLLGSLQATVLATFMRVQAVDKQEANNWIQQDLELIRYQAFILDNPNPTPDVDFGSLPTVSSSDACDTSQYGKRLEELIDDTYLATLPITIDNKDYVVTRTYTASANLLQVEYSIEYASTHSRYRGATADNEVTNLSTEVIPNAALDCP